MGKLVPLLIILLIIGLFFFHRAIPNWTRRLGRRLGDMKRAGEEIIFDEEVPGSPLAAYELEAGKAMTARLLAENPLSADLQQQERVYQIGNRLSAQAARREVRFRFAIIESAEPNAMAIPGGSIFITRPLVALCGGDDHRLAGILGHEIAHLDRRHAVKSYAARAAARTGMRVLALGRGVLLSQVVAGLETLIAQGYSRDQELEADQVGAHLAAAAGYDPLALARLFRDLRERPTTGGHPMLELLPFFKSHPPFEERIRALEAHWSARRA
ncbi:MAG: M48 family metalloprotease [Planctomycetes bacterium]|nr:M48 family metalloprotease [Planctomycetota bacterium]